MLNKEKYADKIIRFFLDGTRIAVLKDTNEVVKCNSVCRCIDCKFNVKDGVCSIKKLQEWANAEYKEPILNEVEREYLSAVCRPYKVETICKKSTLKNDSQWLYIRIDNVILGGYEYIHLPYFKANTMYKGMELEKAYTPQELGIKCRNNPNGEIKHD